MYVNKTWCKCVQACRFVCASACVRQSSEVIIRSPPPPPFSCNTPLMPICQSKPSFLHGAYHVSKCTAEDVTTHNTSGTGPLRHGNGKQGEMSSQCRVEPDREMDAGSWQEIKNEKRSGRPPPPLTNSSDN